MSEQERGGGHKGEGASLFAAGQADLHQRSDFFSSPVIGPPRTGSLSVFDALDRVPHRGRVPPP